MLNDFLIRQAIAQSAALVAQYLDSEQITPGRLEQIAVQAERAGAAQREWFILGAVRQISTNQLATVRRTLGRVADDLRRWHSPPGRAWHPYLEILAAPQMAVQHPQHVAVIMRHGQWYQQEMDRAMDYLFGPDGKAQHT